MIVWLCKYDKTVQGQHFVCLKNKKTEANHVHNSLTLRKPLSDCMLILVQLLIHLFITHHHLLDRGNSHRAKANARKCHVNALQASPNSKHHFFPGKAGGPIFPAPVSTFLLGGGPILPPVELALPTWVKVPPLNHLSSSAFLFLWISC